MKNRVHNQLVTLDKPIPKSIPKQYERNESL